MLNPVFRKDMRVLFRNIKVYIGLAVYLFVLLGVTNLILKMININNYNGFNPEYIMIAYLVMFGFQMLTLTFIIPAVTASSISGERERQTLDFLLVTRMSGWDIVVGKLMSSLLLVGLLIVASMPVYAILFYYGGVSVSGFILNTVFLLIYSCFVGSIAVFFSTIIKKTAAATAVSNLFIIGITIGTGIAVLIIVGFYNTLLGAGTLSQSWSRVVGALCIIICSTNPVVCFISIVDSQVGSNVLWTVINDLIDTDFSFQYLQVWHFIAVIYIILSVLLLKLSARNILPVKRKKHGKHTG